MSNKGTSIQINIPSNIKSEEQNAVTNFSQEVVRYAVKALLNGTETKASIISQTEEIKNIINQPEEIEGNNTQQKVNTTLQGNAAEKVNNNNPKGGAKKPKSKKSPAKKPKSKKSPAKKPKRKSPAKK